MKLIILKKMNNYLHIIGSLSILCNLFVNNVVHSSEPSIAVGYGHYLALNENGTVCAWGDNDYGQLGDGTIVSKTGTVTINELENIKAIAAGRYHSIALTLDGSILAWGSNEYGQLGDGTTIHSNTPILLKNIYFFQSITAGNYHSVALTDTGEVWTWGKNEIGQLGNGTNNDSDCPVRIPDFYNIISISASNSHTVALKKDGTVWAWGQNNAGQLGNSNHDNSNIPVQTKNIQDVIQISTDNNHTIALKNDGSVWMWGGYNSYLPVQVDNLYDIQYITTGGGSSFATNKNNTVWTWGFGANYFCQQNEILPFSSSKPVQIDFIENIKNVSAGYLSDSPFANTTLFLKNDGSVWSLNTFKGMTITPSQVKNLINITSIEMSDSIYTAQDREHIWIWGQNLYGSYGHYIYAPIPLNNLTNVKTFTAGTVHLFWITENETLWGWGGGWEGADSLWGLNNLRYSEPTLIYRFDTKIEDVVAYGDTAFAIDNNGDVWVWGSNQHGQFGNGTTESSSITPIKISNISNVISLRSSFSHVIALKNDGTVWTWGDNDNGDLGDGSTESNYIPTQIKTLDGIIRIDTGFHSVALKNDGTVWTWGSNWYGQLGDGTTQSSYVPQKVENLSNVKDISAGRFITLALKEDGTVWTWGQFGEGETINNNKTPSKVENLSSVRSIKAAWLNALALKNDGSVWAWGYSKYLGMGVPLQQIKNTNGSLLKLFNPSNDYDLNNDNRINLEDLILLFQFLTNSNVEIEKIVNNLSIKDAVYLLNYLIN